MMISETLFAVRRGLIPAVEIGEGVDIVQLKRQARTAVVALGWE